MKFIYASPVKFNPSQTLQGDEKFKGKFLEESVLLLNVEHIIVIEDFGDCIRVIPSAFGNSSNVLYIDDESYQTIISQGLLK